MGEKSPYFWFNTHLMVFKNQTLFRKCLEKDLDVGGASWIMSVALKKMRLAVTYWVCETKAVFSISARGFQQVRKTVFGTSTCWIIFVSSSIYCCYCFGRSYLIIVNFTSGINLIAITYPNTYLLSFGVWGKLWGSESYLIHRTQVYQQLFRPRTCWKDSPSTMCLQDEQTNKFAILQDN